MQSRFSVFACLFFIVFITILILFQANPLPESPVSDSELMRIKAESLLKISRPEMGYRFVINGDFDGDGKPETLLERFTDSLYVNEVPKYYISNDTTFQYEDVLFLNRYYNRQSFLYWKDKKLKIKGGTLGFHYIENCGDVNADGKDEILFVEQYDDYSNLNTAHIYTYNKGKWEEIYKTHVWEWQFPLTPSVSMIPGLFGNFQIGTTEDANADVQLERELKAFRFINHYPDHSVEFSGMNDLGIWDDEAAEKELDSIGDQAYINKYFDKVNLNDSIYVRRKDNPSVLYKVKEIPEENVILFPLDDPADMITTRIFINHPQSPFKNKPRK
nr:hypothetical protein [uncultured Flavobacterium sp.]